MEPKFKMTFTGETMRELMTNVIVMARYFMEDPDAAQTARKICGGETPAPDVPNSGTAAPNMPPQTAHPPATPPITQAPVAASAPVPTMTPSVPVTAPGPAPVPVQATPQSSAPAPTAPTAAPSYNLGDIMTAGANFITQHPEKQDQLNGLFPQFGITTLSELRPEQMGPFATAMRALGVQI